MSWLQDSQDGYKIAKKHDSSYYYQSKYFFQVHNHFLSIYVGLDHISPSMSALASLSTIECADAQSSNTLSCAAAFLRKHDKVSWEWKERVWYQLALNEIGDFSEKKKTRNQHLSIKEGRWTTTRMSDRIGILLL